LASQSVTAADCNVMGDQYVKSHYKTQPSVHGDSKINKPIILSGWVTRTIEL